MIKKIYIVLLLLCSTYGLAQGPPPLLPVKINRTGDPQSTYSPEQLIEDVLIDSPCSVVSDFSYQVSGNPGDNTTKSYGYFINSGGSSTFPFQEGIVLTTGQAYPAGNIPAGLISNQNGLPGDADLEVALGQTNTNDATFIKFTFTPVADKISFRYLMASEEYDGATECDFADSFAFLLREVGSTAYTNLAVLPDGTPVSVTNINNSSLINNGGGSANCDANIPYFDGYNIGDTNYGGRTVVLTASADVIPNQPYEIKLVVADQGDDVWDSAIFIEAGSFNIGLDLGEDLTIAGGNSACSDEPLRLDTLIDTTIGSHTWYQDGVLIPGANDSFIDVLVDGEYKVIVDFTGGCSSTDTIIVE
ncbi:MAG: gliding motility protein, partial [Bacteroidetes bacterium]